MRSTAVYGILLVAMLAFAWARYTREPEPDIGDKVVLLAGERDKLDKLVWRSDRDEAVIEKRKDDRGEYLWVTYTKYVKKKGEDGEEEKEPQVQVFKAGEKGWDLLDKFSPLLALRKLELDTPDKVEKAGLDEPKATIEVTRSGRTVTLSVGGEVYGTRDVYVRNEQTGEAFLVDDEVIRPLKYARTRLPDRTLWSFEKSKIASALIEDAEGHGLEVEHLNPQDPDKARWARASNPDERDEQLATWMDKALRLRGTVYAKPDEQPENLVLRFKLTLRDERDDHETLEVYQEGDDGAWWGRSEHTRGLVKLLRGPTSTLAEDVADLVGGE